MIALFFVIVAVLLAADVGIVHWLDGEPFGDMPLFVGLALGIVLGVLLTDPNYEPPTGTN